MIRRVTSFDCLSHRLRPSALFLLLLCLLIGGRASAGADLRCLWTEPRSQPPASSQGLARIQYTQLFDDELATILVDALGPDRSLRFRYQKDWPDDHVFPNGVSMGRIHGWLTALFAAWNREPWMPLHLTLERGAPPTDNVIFLDDTSSETAPNTGLGGYNYRYQGTNVSFQCRALLNVAAGSLNRRDAFVALAKHELGHCLTLRHSANRAAAMGYATGSIDYGASTDLFSQDDLLGLRSVWARNARGFGSLAGQLLYPDGSPVGGADVAAVEEGTGEVIASGVSDIEKEGRFRIELPAGRRVRLIAHPLRADQALFGEHFLPLELLTPGDFLPTEFRDADRNSVFTVPDGAAKELSPLTVDPPAVTPLLNLDAPVAALLPGERRHLSFRFSGVGTDPVEVKTTLPGLLLSHQTHVEDRVEFDLTAAADAVGVSSIAFHTPKAANVQIGSLWVRPSAGLVRASEVSPLALTRGATTDVVITGIGLDRVTGVRLMTADNSAVLATRLLGIDPDGRLRVAVTVPAAAKDGPWEIELLTPEGEAPMPSEPRPRLWAVRGRIQADPVVDLGELPVGQPVDVAVNLTNHSSASYQVNRFRWISYLGETAEVKFLDSPALARGGTGQITLSLTPRRLGLTVVDISWMRDDQVDATTQVRLWAVP